MKKFYIYRIINHNGHKEYKRTKCTDHWSSNKNICWKFSEQGAKKIVKTCEENNPYNYYSYGIEEIPQ